MSEQSYSAEEAPTQALIVPENQVEAAMDSLNKLFKDRFGGDNGEGNGNGNGEPKVDAAVQGTACHYTGVRPHRDHHCGDVQE
jgi:hypothetical protein